MKPLIFSYPGNEALATSLAKALQSEQAEFQLRKFPDSETYLRFLTPLQNRDLVVCCSLDHPDEKTLSLIFITETARELGAKQIGLVAPYLGYLRQDKRFHEGEALTSHAYAKLLSHYFDWLITVDPHLHRIRELSQVYSIPTKVVHGASEISKWIRERVKNPILIGPDSESQQWVEVIAHQANAPFLVCEKERLGDREVKLSVPLKQLSRNLTPVLVDDIISTGRSMAEVLKQIQGHTQHPPICIAVHALFAEDAYPQLLNAGAAQVITCNTITHPSNVIDLSVLLSRKIKDFF